MTDKQMNRMLMVTLNDGNKLPLVGYGTSKVMGVEGLEAIKIAIQCGYRYFDTAFLYLNEEEVGSVINQCIKEGIVKRDDLYICTKVWCTSHKRESVMRACKDSLRRLGLTYLDLYLIHWPVAYVEDGNDPINPKDPETGKLMYSDVHFTETWRGMEDVKDAGLTRSIGVSNFNHEMIEEILAMPCKYKPTVNQVECHPYLSQQKLLDHSNKFGIHLTAYCPLGSICSCAKPGQPAVLADPVVCELAKKHNKSPANILIRYQVQRNISSIPKSVTPSRIKENLEVFDFNLDEGDMKKLIELNKNMRYCLDTAGEYVDDHPLYPFHIEY